MMSNVFSFINSELDTDYPYKLIREQFVVVCPHCHEPGKGYVEAYLNQGQCATIIREYTLYCGNKQCGGETIEIIVMYLEYR